ncbi:Kelch motif family protein [Trichomonas vaginalis G3]|uniref:Kelch motif family protein n=1 Tax=Trichomonas vaginalis (strain ATCC PRA-98 / G3) TaxID=412133 RepID=A2EGH2_TRIV3|nr:nitrile biosynthetic process [Trichomonas vaginalis G3]EAY08255.1 Kelch motif family protein [Trichomonas vaginalis G3]KAI5507508.1 nitrile biosynthetic process [Trichomonas vaginalis G3]|eukprot:XP_001320478.1 Kelch motif family protein [Trichomonas vaginalis G3]
MGPSPSTADPNKRHHSRQHHTDHPNEEQKIDPIALQEEFFAQEALKPLLRTGFAGQWSVETFVGKHPVERNGQFSVISKLRNSLIIGYGQDTNGVALNDVWELNLDSKQWHQIKLKGDIQLPRISASACIQDEILYIFGGRIAGTYLDDLHSIDLKTGEVKLISTHNDPPSPRASPVIAVHNNNLYVWGGLNEAWPDDLHTLDLSTGAWSTSKPGLSGRANIPTAIYENCVYGYGCSRSGGFIVIDLENGQATIKKADGEAPPSDINAGGMCLVDHFLIYFGGISENEYMLVHACDLHRMRWFTFWVTPDGETVTQNDGFTDEKGLFHLPNIHSFSVAYSEKTREIVSCLGVPAHDPPMVSIFSVGEALSVLHLRDDLLDTLSPAQN